MEKKQSFEMEPRLGGVIFALLLLVATYFFGEFKFFQIKIESSWQYPVLFVLGSFVSACLVREFSIKVPSGRELTKGLLGGILFALGILLAGGGTLYSLYFHLSHFTLSGLLSALGIALGLVLGAKYQAWEIEKKTAQGGLEIRLPKLNPLLALIGIAVTLFLGFKISFYLLFFVLLGIVAERARLCLSISVREVFFSGKARVSQGIILSILIFSLGIFFLKVYGKWQEGVMSEGLWWLCLLGGVLMGFSTILMEADGISLLWKTGEGRVKAIFSLVSCLVCLKTFQLVGVSKFFAEYLKVHPISLEKWLGIWGSPALLVFISAIFYFLTWYNARTKKWVKPML